MAKRKPVKPEDRIDFEIPGKDGKKTKVYIDKKDINEFGHPKLPSETIPVIYETPLDNRIIVKEDEVPSKRASGIVLEGESKIKPYTGVVLASGPDCSTVKLHNQVRYPKRAGEQIEINGEEYLMLRETDCYTILNK